MILNGRVGQVTGPFIANQNLCAIGGAIYDFAIAQTQSAVDPIRIQKLGIQAEPGTKIKINNIVIKLGKTGIYELDYTVEIRSLLFPEATTDEVIVDFVY